jgi:hypothetical protein
MLSRGSLGAKVLLTFGFAIALGLAQVGSAAAAYMQTENTPQGAQAVTPGGPIVMLASPQRVVDTRNGTGGFTGPIVPGTDHCFTLGGVSGVPADATEWW